ncbi:MULTISPECIES: XkdX family protein [Limosilactobacillus]|nr:MULTISPECIES: XkdX family protein [Limosilactobacillus]MDM8259620.1 XkdX family protein [Limosilactobacillus vaginalis]MDY4865178.1 XkdX family protein [Limosilactobacillus sp.]
MANNVMFNVYKSYYELKLFTADDIKLFVEVGDLSQEQANQIIQPAA